LVTIFVFYKFPLLRLLLLLPIPSSVASPKFWDGLNIFDFKRETVFGVGHCLSKHKTASYAKNFWGPRPLWLHSWVRLCPWAATAPESLSITWDMNAYQMLESIPNW